MVGTRMRAPLRRAATRWQTPATTVLRMVTSSRAWPAALKRLLAAVTPLTRRWHLKQNNGQQRGMARARAYARTHKHQRKQSHAGADVARQSIGVASATWRASRCAQRKRATPVTLRIERC